MLPKSFGFSRPRRTDEPPTTSSEQATAVAPTSVPSRTDQARPELAAGVVPAAPLATPPATSPASASPPKGSGSAIFQSLQIDRLFAANAPVPVGPTGFGNSNQGSVGNPEIQKSSPALQVDQIRSLLAASESPSVSNPLPRGSTLEALTQGTPHSPATPQPSAAPAEDRTTELYADLFSGSPSRQISSLSPMRSVLQKELNHEVPAPPTPNSLADSGMTLGQLSDGILKQLYLHGGLLGADVSRNTCLPFTIVDEGLKNLKEQRCIEISGGDMLGRISFRFSLTDLGRVRAREAFEHCRYVGPAPVPLEQYIAQSRRQAVAGTPCSPQTLQEVVQHLVLPDGLIDEIGPAIITGQSIFLFGPPGNGKTVIAKSIARFLNQFGGEIYVPSAIQTENSIIAFFDPVVHQETEPNQAPQIKPGSSLLQESSVDQRWRKVRRPVVITGGELTLDQLELQYHAQGNYYTAPVHLKANGGVFFVDDFGRQVARPQELLNRWIVPLEERIDYLTLSTGRKVAVPFEQLVIFSTNLEPRDLVDDAFLRRIRHRIRINSPSREMYCEIFRQECLRRQIIIPADLSTRLFDSTYSDARRPRASDPRDLIQLCESICRFYDQRLELTEELLREAARRFFLL